MRPNTSALTPPMTAVKATTTPSIVTWSSAAYRHRRKTHQQRDRSVGQRETASRAEYRQHQTLASGADGRSAALTPPAPVRKPSPGRGRRAAREQQVGEVHAGDQQHAAHRGQQHEQRLPCVADQPIELRCDAHAADDRSRSDGRAQGRRQYVEFRLRGRDRRPARSRPITLRSAPRCSAVIGESPGIVDSRVLGVRDPDVRRRDADRKMKPRAASRRRS